MNLPVLLCRDKRVDAEDADGADGAATNTDSTAGEENTDEISLDIAG